MALSDLFLKVVLTNLIQSWYDKNVTKLTTQGCYNIVISRLYRTCWNNVATSLIISTRLLQVVNSLFQTCWQLVTSSANTTCWRLVGRLATRCEIFTCVYACTPCGTHVKTHKLQQTCSRLVAMLFQQLVNRMCSHCLLPACWQVVTTWYKVVELNRLVTSCSNNLLSSCNSTICQQVVTCEWQPCSNLTK
jgi:hypothetical protein